MAKIPQSQSPWIKKSRRFLWDVEELTFLVINKKFWLLILGYSNTEKKTYKNESYQKLCPIKLNVIRYIFTKLKFGQKRHIIIIRVFLSLDQCSYILLFVSKELKTFF